MTVPCNPVPQRQPMNSLNPRITKSQGRGPTKVRYNQAPSLSPHPQRQIEKGSLQGPYQVFRSLCLAKSFDKNLTPSQGSPLHLTTDLILIPSSYYLPVRSSWLNMSLFPNGHHKIRYQQWPRYSGTIIILLLDTLLLLPEPRSHCGLTLNNLSNETRPHRQVFFMLPAVKPYHIHLQ